MQFKLDENLPESLASEFEAAGHEAVSTVAQGLQGELDSRIAEACREEGRILVTLDRALPTSGHTPHRSTRASWCFGCASNRFLTFGQ